MQYPVKSYQEGIDAIAMAIRAHQSYPPNLSS
jgi:hypothetical protein